MRALLIAGLLSSSAVAGEHSVIGASVGLGATEGASASLALRPLSFLRFEAGVTTDLAAPGARGEIVLSVPWYVSPALSIGGGKQWPGNLNRVVGRVTGSDPQVALLDHFGFLHADFHGGLELGHPDWFMLVLHAGYSYVLWQTSGLPAFIASKTSDARAQGEATVRVWTPTARVALLFYFH
jgi:hypothetical protein